MKPTVSASRSRLQSFAGLRDEAQFLGTLYTGMDLAANLEAARTSVQKALAVYGVSPGSEARPNFDAYLNDAQKSETLADCSQLLLILAETEAQSTSREKPAENEAYLRKALGYAEQARRLGAPPRAFHLRRARYLNLLGDKAGAATAERAAQSATLNDVFDFFLMADELYRREQFGEAIKEFDRVLERKPGHFWAQYLNALCLLRQQRPAEARALSERLSGSALRFCVAVSAEGLCPPGAPVMGGRGIRLRAGFANGARRECALRAVRQPRRFAGPDQTPGRCDRRSEGSDFAQATRVSGVCQPGAGVQKARKARGSALGAGPRGQARARRLRISTGCRHSFTGARRAGSGAGES